MDQQLLQRTRYLLQTRFRKIYAASGGNFELIVKQIFDWLESHPILGSVINHLDNIEGEHHDEIQRLLFTDVGSSRYYQLSVKYKNEPGNEDEPNFRGYTPTTIEQHASACLQVLRATLQRPDIKFYCLLAVYLTQEDYDVYNTENSDPFGPLKDLAAHDLYEYLDERLDGINAVNGLLLKYKQDVEWFQLERIHQIVNEGYGGEKGERALALHLQQYVFNQSVEFVVEPTSASGEVDLLLRDSSGQYTIIDAKLVKADSVPSVLIKKVAEGFNQVARYCEDFNQPEGFLAVFVDKDISILLDIEQNGAFKFLKIGGHIIYYIEINIAERPSASKSGKATQVHITREQLLKTLDEVQNTPNL